MTTRGQGFCFRISCERTTLAESSIFKGTVPWATWRRCHQLEEASASFHHPGLCFCLLLCPESCNCTARWRQAPVPDLAENTGVNLTFAVGRAQEEDGWARRQWDQGDQVAFGTNTALNRLMLIINHFSGLATFSGALIGPVMFKYWPKLDVRSMESLNDSYPSSLGY